MKSVILITAFFLSSIYAQSGINQKCGGRRNRKCAAGLCCSQWGYCGTSEWHCNDGCQASFGICNAPTSTSIPTITVSSSTSIPTITSSTVTSSTSPLPTSTVYAYLNQKCGVINGQIVRAYPGDGDKTKSGLCCSASGFAGITRDHCGTGCQASYGRCGSSNTPLLNMGCVKPNDFALTFDDGPSIITDSLLDYLKRVSVKVTFFVNGISSLGQTDIPRIKIYDPISTAALKRAFADGHQICSHTWSHQSLVDVSDYNATYEMTRLNQAFKTIIGKIPTCMRPPYGNINDNTAKLLQGLGYGPDSNGGNAGIIMWNLDPAEDWNPSIHGSQIPAQIASEAKEYQLQTSPQANLGIPTLLQTWTGTTTGSPSTIALNHDVWAPTADFRPDGLVIPLKTTPLVQQAIEYLKSRNFNLVTVDQCVGKPVGSMYRDPNPNDDVCGDQSSYGGGNCFV